MTSSACSCVPKCRKKRLLRPAEQAVVGPQYQQGGGHAYRRCRSFPAGRIQIVRRHAGQARVPVAAGPRQRLHAGMGGTDYRHFRRNHPPSGARDGHHGARPEDRTAHRLDRFMGQGARHRHRQSGVLPCHARTGGALQRFPHDTRAVHPDDAPGHYRSSGWFPPQDPVPASDSALCAYAERSACGATEYAAGRHGAGLAVRSGRPVRQCRRQPGAYRQGIFLGISAVGARLDA